MSDGPGAAGRVHEGVGQAPPPSHFISWPLKVLGGFAGLLILFLVVGFLLPGTWTATRRAAVDAAPPDVFAWITAPAAWRSWTALPDVALTPSGPASGVGASMSWDDPNYGDGVFTITGSDPPRSMAYEVRVQHGSQVIEGHLQVAARNGGSEVTWTERGDFGWNPLLAYWALGMNHMQGAELEKGLARLGKLAAEGPPGADALDWSKPAAADTTAGDTASAASPAGSVR